MYKPALLWASVFGALAVILGAFGAHALKPILEPSLLNSYETAVKYQFYHVLALAFVGVANLHFASKFIRLATWSFITGIILFCGSIYALVALKTNNAVGLSSIGVITPIGGLFLILGWVFVFISIQKNNGTQKIN